MCQLAKKYESSKATAKHIKQVAGEVQATQIHLMRHQCTELPMVNTRSGSSRPNQGPHNTKVQSKGNKASTRSSLTPEVHTSRKIDAVNLEIPPTWKVLHAL